MSMADRIKYYRQALGLSLQEVANYTDVNRENIFRYENGKIANIPVTSIEGMARAFHIKPCTLCGWDKSLATCNSTAVYNLNDLYKAISERVPLTEQEVREAIAFAIAMKGQKNEKVQL